MTKQLWSEQQARIAELSMEVNMLTRQRDRQTERADRLTELERELAARVAELERRLNEWEEE